MIEPLEDRRLLAAPLQSIDPPGTIATTPRSEFGEAVAISGNTVVVGAYQDDAGANDSGAVYATAVSILSVTSSARSSPSISRRNRRHQCARRDQPDRCSQVLSSRRRLELADRCHGDLDSEADEEFGMLLSNVQNAVNRMPQGIGFILNDDPFSYTATTTPGTPTEISVLHSRAGTVSKGIGFDKVKAWATKGDGDEAYFDGSASDDGDTFNAGSVSYELHRHYDTGDDLPAKLGGGTASADSWETIL